MKYFENLPIVSINEEEFRNLFRRVVVNYVREEQLINYQIKDFETLPSIAHTQYGNAQLWWVVALLNNILDINYDMPLTVQQIEDIASETAIYNTFPDSILTSGLTYIAKTETEKTITFTNADSDDYVVMMTQVVSAASELISIGYGYQKINTTSFKLIIPSALAEHTKFCYVVIKQPTKLESLSPVVYSQVFNNLMADADTKRMIRLIKPQHMGTFLSKFIPVLIGEEDIEDIASLDDETEYKTELNSLKEYDDPSISDYGLIVVFDETTFLGSTAYQELTIDDYDYDYQVHVIPKPDDASDLSDVGIFGVKNGFTKPRVYNTGTGTSKFDYLVIAPDNKDFSTDGEIIQSGIGDFAGIASSDDLILEDSDISSANELGMIVTPIVENVYDFALVENFGITPVDKNNCSVYNNGLAKGKYYWSLFKNLVIDLPQTAIPGLSWAEIEPSGMREVMGIDSVGTRVFFSTGINMRKLFFTDDFITFTEGTLSAGTGLGFGDVCAVTSTLIVAIDGYNFWISSNAGVDYTRSTALTGGRNVIEKINDTTVVVAGTRIHVINATDGTVIRSITSPGGTITSILKIDENNFVCGGFNGTNAAIFRTDNQFVSITKVDEDTSAATTGKGAVVRTDGTTLYAKMPVGTNTLIKKSVDGGTTWTLLSTVAIVSDGDFYVHNADVSVMSALTKQYISIDGHLNYVEKTTIQGNETHVYHLLESGNLLAGTSGTLNNALWVSVPEEPS